MDRPKIDAWETHIFDMEGFRQAGPEPFNKDFCYLFNAYYNLPYNLAYSIVKNREDAREIACYTFKQLWHLREEFHTLENVKGFLCKTARDASIDLLLKRNRKKK